MISFIKGIVEYINEGHIVIENNGIGYDINVSSATTGRLKLHSEAKIYTYMAVREDEISLYGFMNREEFNMFNLLIGVTGVGPKSALSLLGSMAPSELALAIITDDIKALSGGQGIGKKTAQRIALELRDKISNEQAASDSSVITAAVSDSSARNEAMEGLMALGFSKAEANKAIAQVYSEDMTSSQIISKALRALS